MPVARAGLMAQVDFPAERHEGTRAVLVANSGKRGKQSLYFLELYAAGTGGLGTRLLPSRSLRSRHQVLAPHAHAGIGTRGPQRAAAERPHLPHRPYPLALHFSKRFGMPAINFSKKLGPPSSAGWL